MAVTNFDLAQSVALLVQDVERDRGRDVHRHPGGAATQRLLLDGAQDIERRRLGGTNMARAAATGARLGAGFHQARPEPLPRQLEQAEQADPADLDARAIVPHRLLQTAFDGDHVLLFLHVDEVDDDQPGQVAQPELAGDLVGRLDIGLQGGFLDVAFAGRASRVDVDRDQRLGRAEDDVAARLQLHRRVVDGVELGFDLITMEHRHRRVAVWLHLLGMGRNHLLHEVLGHLVVLVAVDHDLVDILGVEIADRALDDVGLLVNEGGRGGDQGAFANLVP